VDGNDSISYAAEEFDVSDVGPWGFTTRPSFTICFIAASQIECN
jgi:hypothetical protein